jgi:hypothetical protein
MYFPFPCENVHGTRPFSNRLSTPEYAIPPQMPNAVPNDGRRLRTSYRSSRTHDACSARSYGPISAAAAAPSSPSLPSNAWSACTAPSAASIPLFIALCVPLIFATFTKPALHPIRAPPGKWSLGTDWRPPSVSTRAAYAMRSAGGPPSVGTSRERKYGWCFIFCDEMN